MIGVRGKLRGEFRGGKIARGAIAAPSPCVPLSLLLSLLLSVMAGVPASGFARPACAKEPPGGEMPAATLERGGRATAGAPSDAPEGSGGRALGEAPDVARLLKRFDEMYTSSGTMAEVEIVITTPKKTRTLRMRTWSKGREKALIIIDAPARDAGTATLKVGSNLWNYLPKIARTIRVPPSMMMGSWMGSDLTNDDLVRDASYERDYTSEWIGHSDDPPGWKARLDARPGVAGLWNRVEIVFSYEHELPLQVQYFDRKDRLSRTMRLDEMKEIGGRRVAMLATVVPEREEGRRTELRYLRLDFDAEVGDEMFSLAHLERAH